MITHVPRPTTWRTWWRHALRHWSGYFLPCPYCDGLLKRDIAASKKARP